MKKISDDIRDYGWHVIKVLEDESAPGFGYSIGLFETFKHPEIIIVGLKLDLIHLLINNIGEDIKNGLTLVPFSFNSDIIDNFECYISEVKKSHYDKYVGQAQAYYDSDEFPLLQCIYPTLKGVYPWQSDWPEDIKNLQPVLGQIRL